MKRHIRLTTIVSLLALLLTISGAALAQEVTANLNGTVKDTTGALVTGATVTLTDTDKKVVVRTLTTGDEGEWTAPNLLAGNYSISIEAPGFKKVVQGDIKLDVGQRRTVDMTLEAGDIAETVMVQTDPVAVELTTATTSTLVNGDQARELSLNNRNWVQLVALSPGVSNDLADQVYVGTTNPDGQANTVNLAVNGARSSQNTFTVDGADITDRGSNLTIQAYPSVDSIGEFRVLRSLFPAESGRSGGGQVNVITRSGGDQFHGSAYEFIRNDAFNANSFLNNAVTNPQFGRDDNGKAKRPPFRYNNYGWTLSGPVYFPRFGEGGAAVERLERTFFFFSQEFRKDRRFSAAVTTVVPDAAIRQGIFPIDVCINRNNVPSENCDPGNPGRLPAGVPLPASFLNPAAAGYLEGIYRKLPLPNAATPAAPYNLNASIAGIADFRQEIIKIDHTFTSNWSGYYRFQKDTIPTVDGNALFNSGSNLPGVSTTETDSPGKTHTAQTTYVVNPNLILEGRYTYGWGAILSRNVGLLALANTTVPVNLPFENQRDRVPTIAPT
ncbi:MAG TPA: carboxypeptidase-like regulatory domain-containing protein, partial [Pyrinomonadaceae bacterium]